MFLIPASLALTQPDVIESTFVFRSLHLNSLFAPRLRFFLFVAVIEHSSPKSTSRIATSLFPFGMLHLTFYTTSCYSKAQAIQARYDKPTELVAVCPPSYSNS